MVQAAGQNAAIQIEACSLTCDALLMQNVKAVVQEVMQADAYPVSTSQSSFIGCILYPSSLMYL